MSGLSVATHSTATGQPSVAGGAVDVLLVCHSGGHLAQLTSLEGAWSGYSSAWVTDASADAKSLLRGERVYYGHGPASRSAVDFVRNLVLALRLLAELKPRVIVSTGAAMCVPFLWIGRLRGAQIVYVETVTRIASPSLTCRLVRRVATRVYVQWPELAARIPGAIYVGSVFPAP